MRVPTDASTGAQSIQVMRMNVAVPTYSTTTTNYNTLGYWYGVSGTSMISCNIPVQAGDIIGVLGYRGQINSYATPAGPYNTTIAGQSVTLTRFGFQGNIDAGTSAGAVWQEPGGSISRVELYYTTVTAPNDAGVLSIDSPNNFCAGTHDVKVTLKNFGSNQLTSATINWSLNGTPKTPYSWSGLLDTLTAASRITQVTLGTENFLPGVSYTIRAWTSMPNGIADTVNKNDTVQVVRKSSLNGTFTIGGASPNYTTFAAAAADLVANGVCGPVVFNVRPGTYTERVDLPAIAGTSATNTVTFQSESGVKTSVILQYSSSSTTNLGTVNMGGADWVTFKDMTIQTQGTTYAAAVQFSGNSDNNTFQNNVLKGYAAATTSTYQAVIYSPSGTTDHNNSFIGNSIESGSYGAYYYGSSSETNTRFENNTFTGQYYMGLTMYYQDVPIIKNNILNFTSTYSTNYLFYLYYLTGAYRVTGNKLFSNSTTGTRYGMYIYTSTAANNAATAPLIANNFISLNSGSSVTYGIWLYYGSWTNVFHNTIHLRSTSTSSRALTVYYGNDNKVKDNIFYATSGAMSYYFLANSYLTDMDYNTHYTTGTNLAYLGGSYATSLGAMQTLLGGGRELNSKFKTITFTDPNTGDLHLSGASQSDPALVGTMLTEVTDDIDGDPRALPYMGADEACYILRDKISASIQDANGSPLTYVSAPGTVYINYSCSFPINAFTLTVSLKLYDVTTNTLVFQGSFQVNKPQGQPASGISPIVIPNTVPPNTYRAEVVFNMHNSCENYVDQVASEQVFLVVPQGQVPCVVWPGDANNDGIVNYGDRSALNRYISNANLRATWLQGPARYRVDFATNPFTYYTWEGQVAVPW
ncbi:MAG: right-handed parallel beta-helix repeat-containing protein, partial [Ignavibacteriae bacterium]|nr:right-handed parallel beta-helix repeat-containing protein [Ignavibacteriota bacterium]